MKISVVIPVINEFNQIRQSIALAWQAGADEVVVVDGGSTDRTRELAIEMNCVFEESISGRAVQMNRGAAVAVGDVLLFLHADNSLAPGACDQIRELFRTTEHKFGGFRQEIQSQSNAFRWIELGNETRLVRQGLIYGDQAMFINRDLFEQLGGFPEIELMEDFKFSISLRKFGKPALLDGPTLVSARRWERNGWIRQTILNWSLSFAFRMGASPGWIARQYRRHDK